MDLLPWHEAETLDAKRDPVTAGVLSALGVVGLFALAWGAAALDGELWSRPEAITALAGVTGAGLIAIAIHQAVSARRLTARHAASEAALPLPLRHARDGDLLWIEGVVRCHEALAARHFGDACVWFEYAATRREHFRYEVTQRLAGEVTETQTWVESDGRLLELDLSKVRFDRIPHRTERIETVDHELTWLPAGIAVSVCGRVRNMGRLSAADVLPAPLPPGAAARLPTYDGERGTVSLQDAEFDHTAEPRPARAFLRRVIELVDPRAPRRITGAESEWQDRDSRAALAAGPRGRWAIGGTGGDPLLVSTRRRRDWLAWADARETRVRARAATLFFLGAWGVAYATAVWAGALSPGVAAAMASLVAGAAATVAFVAAEIRSVLDADRARARTAASRLEAESAAPPGPARESRIAVAAVAAERAEQRYLRRLVTFPAPAVARRLGHRTAGAPPPRRDDRRRHRHERTRA